MKQVASDVAYQLNVCITYVAFMTISDLLNTVKLLTTEHMSLSGFIIIYYKNRTRSTNKRKKKIKTSKHTSKTYIVKQWTATCSRNSPLHH